MDNKISVLDVFKQIINAKNIGEQINRYEIINAMNSSGSLFAKSYIDNTRRLLTICEVLEYTGTPGIYVIKNYIPTDWTINSIKKYAKEHYSLHDDKFINNSLKLTQNFKEHLS